MSLYREAIRGVAWTTVGRTLAQLVSFGITVVLARLLTPADFGLLGMGLVFTGFVSMFGELGFGAALVQRTDITEAHLSSVFWLNVVTGIVLAAVTAAAAPLLGLFYDEPTLVPLLRVLSLNFVLAPLTMVQTALLSRSMNFRLLAVAEIASTAVSGTAAVMAAFAGWGVWSLVCKTLVSTVVTSVALWSASQWRPQRIWDRTALRELIGFSSNLLGFMTINYWARQLDALLIGRVMGANALGLYSRAYSTMLLPVYEISGVLSRVMFPTLSKLQADKSEAKRVYLKTIGMIAVVTFPLMGMLFVLTEPFVIAIFGAHWIECAPVLRILSIVGMFQSVGTTVGWLYQSQGRTDLMFRWAIAAGFAIMASLAFGVYLGTIETVALCYAVMSVGVLAYPQFAVPGKLIGVTPADVLRAVSGPLLCTLAIIALLWSGNHWLLRGLSAGRLLSIAAIAGVVAYVLLLRAFRVPAYVELAGFLRESLERRARVRDPSRP
jgi:O-antigen/teichoic acid export membrane protein